MGGGIRKETVEWVRLGWSRVLCSTTEIALLATCPRLSRTWSWRYGEKLFETRVVPKLPHAVPDRRPVLIPVTSTVTRICNSFPARSTSAAVQNRRTWVTDLLIESGPEILPYSLSSVRSSWKPPLWKADQPVTSVDIFCKTRFMYFCWDPFSTFHMVLYYLLGTDGSLQKLQFQMVNLIL